jgi:maltose alpha-D-glucosyltransferase/alpha-amylase
MRLKRTSDLWWKNAVIYCLDVEIFLDSDGDGVGDLGGLIRQIDYLAGLGVTCLWLMPFYPSPNRDDGYDVSDYYGVDERLGSLGEFVELVRTASDRGMKVILDLVVNHTSDQHPWFQAARADPKSPYRSYYVWRDRPAKAPKGIAFPDRETSNWQRDRRAGQYFLHRFYRFQPDLNVGNPAVRDEIAKVVGFWLALGASGFRMDAVPFLLELDGIVDPADGDPHGWLRDLRAFASRRRGETVLLGEVNAALKDLARYFGDEDGDALNMQFAFLLNQQLWLSLAREEAEPLEGVIRSLPPAPADNAWAMFLRNHDELSLDKLTEPQRQEVFAAFGPDPGMQLYGHGLRRRVATMLGGDGPRLRMAWSLMLSLPGTPVIFMGDEIGMAENLDIPDRMSVRVPMQWTDGPNGGFSTARPGDLVRPMVGGRFGADRVNVAAQRRDPDSLLNWMERLIRRRKETPEIGWGTSSLIETSATTVFAHRCEWEGSTVVAVHNLSRRPAETVVDLGVGAGEPVEVDDLLFERRHRPRRDGTLRVKLDGYGYLWLRVLRPGQRGLS